MDRRTIKFCEKVVRLIDPAFIGPCYFVEPRQARAAVAQTGYAAVTRFGLAGDVRGFLERHRLWRGPGFCAAIALDQIHSTLQLAGVVAHEYTHHCQSAAQMARVQDVLGDEQFFRAISTPSDRVQAGTPPEPISSDDAALRTMHDPDFFRLAIHAQYRLWQAGYCTFVTDPQQMYGWPPRMEFVRHLGDEPARLFNLPMGVVAETTPPIEYQNFAVAISANGTTHPIIRTIENVENENV
jgi:hypothetical protein